MVEAEAALKTLHECGGQLVTALSSDPGGAATILHPKGFIPDNVLSEMLVLGTTHNHKAVTLVEALKKTIRNAPTRFQEFVQVLGQEHYYKDIVKILSEKYQAILCEEDSASSVLTSASHGSGNSEAQPDPALGHSRIESDAPNGEEEPKYTLGDNIVNALPRPRRGSAELQDLQEFAKQVDIILHTVNDNETQAVLQDLAAPEIPDSTQMTGPVNLRSVSNTIILGMYAGYKSALVQTAQGETCTKEIEDALEELPNTKAVIAIGVAYTSKAKIKFSDVLVSKTIRTVTNPKFHEGINPRSAKDSCVPVTKELSNVFTRNPFSWKNQFECSRDGRKAEVYAGDIVSVPWLVADQDTRDKLHENYPDAIGGEMEGHELVKIHQKYKEKHPPRKIGVIIIKAAADYGDENKQEGKKWQFTAAKAASSFAKHKLELTQGELFDPDEWSSS